MCALKVMSERRALSAALVAAVFVLGSAAALSCSSGGGAQPADSGGPDGGGEPDGGSIPDGGTDAGEDGGSQDGGSQDGGPPATDTFMVEPDPAMVQVLSTSPDGEPSEGPVNLVLVLASEGVPRSRIEELAASVAGSVVGQVPDFDLYQLELPTTTPAELMQAIASLATQPGVDAAFPSTAGDVRQARSPDPACPPPTDNEQLTDVNRCAYDDDNYYGAITIFEALRSAVQLGPVSVAVIDTPVDPAVALTKTKVLDVATGARPRPPANRDPHGSYVAGVIAADQDGEATNGIASAFLGDALTVLSGDAGRDAGITVQRISQALRRGARVVNLSIGWPGTRAGFVGLRATFRRIVSRHPRVLFVVAAPNQAQPLEDNAVPTRRDDVPASLSANGNVITVGGSAQCSRTGRWSGSAFGPLVSVYAPAERVVVGGVGPGLLVLSGNSYAAPQVSSLAAILFSIAPGLSGAEVKHRIVAQTNGLIQAEGPLISIGAVVDQLLFDFVPSEEVQRVLAPSGFGMPEWPAAVVEYLCGRLDVSIAGYGAFTCRPENWQGMGVLPQGLVSTDRWGVSTKSCHEIVFELECEAAFALADLLRIDPAAGPCQVGAWVPPTLTGSKSGGDFTPSGTIQASRCRILDRYATESRNPWTVAVEGTFSGMIGMIDYPDYFPVRPVGFSGTMKSVLIADPGATTTTPLVDYLERNCTGGLRNE